jgi:hypothetical protein
VAQTIALLSTISEREQDQDVVTLSTLHAAKGLEWPHVMLVGVTEGLLPFKPEDEGRRPPDERGHPAAPAGRAPPDVRGHHARAAHAGGELDQAAQEGPRDRWPRSPAASSPRWRWTRPPCAKTRARSSRRCAPSLPLSRYWELESASDCGTFGIRGYRPISLSWIGSDSVNTAPSSPTAGHTAAYRAYENSEMRIQLSVRTKIAQGLLTDGRSSGLDSLWFGYTQQSYWQLFNRDLSRPFRSTDHEPELTYIYPTDARCRAAGGCATAASARCTSPTGRACRCRAAGTASC